VAGKIFQIAFEIGGKLQPGFSKSILNASSNLHQLDKQISGLGKIKSDITAFKRLQGDIEGTKTSLAAGSKQ